MSEYYYPSDDIPLEEESSEFTHVLPSQSSQPPVQFPAYTEQHLHAPLYPPQDWSHPQDWYQQPQQIQQPLHPQTLPSQPQQQPNWIAPPFSSTYQYSDTGIVAFPQYSEPVTYGTEMKVAGPSTEYLSPDEATRRRMSRTASFTSNVSSTRSYSLSDVSRSVSPNASEMSKWGFKNDNGSWSCAYPGCSSRSTFNRGCDLRKHYKRHTKSLFCRHDGCPQATEGGFSSKKDRARHEARHNPNILCEWEGCDRLFSRVDNMKDHVRRMHLQKLTK